MPDVVIQIGGRDFTVSCQEGEEHYLKSAAAMLDTEAAAMASQIGGLPEGRMLLMAGLMLADKTGGLEDQVQSLTQKIKALEDEVRTLKSTPVPEPERVEVPVIPNGVTDSMAQIAARAEALAAKVEEA